MQAKNNCKIYFHLFFFPFQTVPMPLIKKEWIILHCFGINLKLFSFQCYFHYSCALSLFIFVRVRGGMGGFELKILGLHKPTFTFKLHTASICYWSLVPIYNKQLFQTRTLEIQSLLTAFPIQSLCTVFQGEKCSANYYTSGKNACIS